MMMNLEKMDMEGEISLGGGGEEEEAILLVLKVER